jgi:hypothetical protein
MMIAQFGTNQSEYLDLYSLKKLTFYNFNFYRLTKMNNKILRLLQSINTRLSQNSNNQNSNNQNLILLKLRLLRQYPELTMRNLDEFKGLNFEEFQYNGSNCHFYHAWGIIDNFDEFYKRDKKYNNYHVSVIGNRVVEIWNISTKYSEMNPNDFYYIGVVFGPQVSVGKNEWITSKKSTSLIRHIQTTYSHWFRFSEAEDRFITKSLVGIEDACPICGGDEDLDKCVAVRNGRCDHAFDRVCIERWFSRCGKIICPICRINHNESG